MEFTFLCFHKELVFMKTSEDDSNMFNVFIFRFVIYKDVAVVENSMILLII